ncbi:cytidylate kinase family protein [Streptomyces sp. NPDC020898]|uniref:cytidylate kinase family protein n=1 Tax=Streptomyces sp. NPDC020898 TaxID=3365101 RepID=UPI0037BDC1EF
MNIVISGLTASGKTKFGLDLARQLGFDYVSASQILLDRLGVPLGARHEIWGDGFEAVTQLRDRSEVDRRLDTEMTELIGRLDHTVFDSWALPWFADRSAIKIWLACDQRTRHLKARSPHPISERHSLQHYAQIVDRKDQDSRNRFQKLYGFTYGPNPEVFDCILDSTEYYVDSPTIHSEQRANEFSSLLLREVKQAMKETLSV